jgi:hypothetical protein
MRNVIFAINITLDGCCDHTKMIADEELHEYFTHLMRDVDLLVFGLMSQKAILGQKQRTNLLKHLIPSTKLFFHNH